VETLYLRTERCRGCATLFMICRRCYRGQTYCGTRCRVRERAMQRRAARARHQTSIEGRADHRDRNRQCRLRKRSATTTSVMDQGSTKGAPCSKVSLPTSPIASMSNVIAADGRSTHEAQAAQTTFIIQASTVFRCASCARIGMVVSRWPSRRRQRPPANRRRPATPTTS
jgi:hypothetical protein